MSEFIEMKTAELHGSALDWAVAKATQAEELKVTGSGRISCVYEIAPMEGCWTNDYQPSTEWSEGGPLIEKYHIQTSYNGRGFKTDSGEYWCAYVCNAAGVEQRPSGSGGTPLVAACRAIVATKFPNTVSVPAELVR